MGLTLFNNNGGIVYNHNKDTIVEACSLSVEEYNVVLETVKNVVTEWRDSCGRVSMLVEIMEKLIAEDELTDKVKAVVISMVVSGVVDFDRLCERMTTIDTLESFLRYGDGVCGHT
jgi:hypothetical protein